MTRKIEWPTALVIVAGIIGVVAMAYLKVDTAALAGISAGLIALTGALRQLTYVKPDDTKKDEASK